MELEDVVAELMATSGQRLLRLAFQLCHNQQLAEDVVQEALTRVYGSWRRRAPRIEFAEAYMRKAIVNEHLRRRRLRSSTELVTAQVPDRVAIGFDEAVVARDELWRALETLTARQRTVLVLRYWQALPDVEIAVLIGAQESTVRSLAARGLEALRAPDLIERLR